LKIPKGKGGVIRRRKYKTKNQKEQKKKGEKKRKEQKVRKHKLNPISSTGLSVLSLSPMRTNKSVVEIEVKS
jgi:hypothetical protein